MQRDPTTFIAVQKERIAGAASREEQWTAAVQQLTMEVMELKETNTNLAVALEEDNASADDGSAQRSRMTTLKVEQAAVVGRQAEKPGAVRSRSRLARRLGESGPDGRLQRLIRKGTNSGRGRWRRRGHRRWGWCRRRRWINGEWNVMQVTI